jgi:hypothetical protein
VGVTAGWTPPGDGALTAEQVDLVLAWHGDREAGERWVPRAVSEEEVAWATGAVLVAVRAVTTNTETVRPHLGAALEVLGWLTARERPTDVGRGGVW